MNAIVQITESNGHQLVDARELYTFLEVETRFADWMKRRIKEYGFVEGVDYTSLLKIEKRETGATTRKEYALTLTCAKELSMVEGNKKGKQARLYFIECERRLKNNDLQRRVTALEIEVAQLKQQRSDKKPVVRKALPLGREHQLVEKHFTPSPDSQWTVQDVMKFLSEAEKAKNLNRYRIGKALSRIGGPRQCKWDGNRSQWFYSVTLTA